MATSLLAPAQVDYPSSDGRPMAESDHQRTPLTYAVDRLRHHFRDRDDVYVSGNLLIYYEEGNVGARVAPDVFVVVGAPNRDRSSYLLWQEPKGPDFVLEITSRRTYREDQGRSTGGVAASGARQRFRGERVRRRPLRSRRSARAVAPAPGARAAATVVR